VDHIQLTQEYRPKLQFAARPNRAIDKTPNNNCNTHHITHNHTQPHNQALTPNLLRRPAARA
jgi:hypothetical protein